jgi:hypothetical protein
MRGFTSWSSRGWRVPQADPLPGGPPMFVSESSRWASGIVGSNRSTGLPDGSSSKEFACRHCPWRCRCGVGPGRGKGVHSRTQVSDLDREAIRSSPGRRPRSAVVPRSNKRFLERPTRCAPPGPQDWASVGAGRRRRHHRPVSPARGCTTRACRGRASRRGGARNQLR